MSHELYSMQKRKRTVSPSEYALSLENIVAEALDRASLSLRSSPCSTKALDCKCCMRQLRSVSLSRRHTNSCASLSLPSRTTPPCCTVQYFALCSHMMRTILQVGIVQPHAGCRAGRIQIAHRPIVKHTLMTLCPPTDTTIVPGTLQRS